MKYVHDAHGMRKCCCGGANEKSGSAQAELDHIHSVYYSGRRELGYALSRNHQVSRGDAHQALDAFSRQLMLNSTTFLSTCATLPNCPKEDNFSPLIPFEDSANWLRCVCGFFQSFCYSIPHYYLVTNAFRGRPTPPFITTNP